MNPRYPILVCVAALLLSAAARAQTTPQAPPPQSQDKNVVPQRPGDQAPQDKAPGAASGSLSEQLSRSGGVIHPPTAIDRPIEAPTPNPGARSMPVIPPPGTPGGNPDIKPK